MQHPHSNVPTWLLFVIVICGMLLLQLCVKPWYMRDCMAQGHTEEQCEFSWKWRR